MNIKIGSTELKLNKAEKNSYPKGVRSVAANVTVNGKEAEYQLTTGTGRDGEHRQYIHVKVDGTHYWAKITPEVGYILTPAETTKLAAVVAAAAKIAEQAESDKEVAASMS